ncbi:MATE family efflux transporter [Virgibacillus sp. NKC19-3]|uniref:MATE family efflux transporter n=1 Tax=Virgibacillus saliphilus TaxID=2831674 RepID=UPI001C9A3B1C|nr:MATE family efflux transporter [Virgibacillus sp. NKC19-3]MBY7142553.1 MATE family efflux transporter [Virgibacillus sp. NKC19-3]
MNKLETMPVPKLIRNLSTPAIIALLVNSVNLAIDRIFIAKGVNTLAISAVTVAFGLYLVMQALAQLIGAGAAANLSIALGKGDNEQAKKIVGTSFVLSLTLSLFIVLLGILFLNPVLYLYGANSGNIDYAATYSFVFLLGSVFFVISQSMNSIIRSMGFAKRAFINFIVAILVNIILDPIFIFVLDLGVGGAALALVIGNLASATLTLQFLFKNNTGIMLHYKYMRYYFNEVKQILSVGFSGFIGQISLSLVSLLFNRISYEYGGNTGLAAYGVIYTVAMLVYMPIIGLGQGIQPIIGYSYGHAAIDRVKITMKYAIKYVLFFCIFMFLFIEIFSNYIVSAFGGNADSELLDTATFGMRIFCCMVPIVGVQMIGANFFQYIGEARKAIFLSALRQLILLIPLVYMLPKFLGLLGVWMATPIADLLSFTVVVLYLWMQYRKFKPEVDLKIGDQSL